MQGHEEAGSSDGYINNSKIVTKFTACLIAMLLFCCCTMLLQGRGRMSEFDMPKVQMLRANSARRSELVESSSDFYQGMANGLEGMLHKLKQMDLGSDVKERQPRVAKKQVSQQKELLNLASSINSKKQGDTANSILRNLQKELFASIDVKQQARDRMRARRLRSPRRPDTRAEGTEVNPQAVKQQRDSYQRRARSSPQKASSLKPKQQLQSLPAPAPPGAAPEEGKLSKKEEIKEELEAAQHVADAAWSGLPPGGEGQEDEKKENIVSSVINSLFTEATGRGVNSENDIAAIHRLQKAYPYNVPGISQTWAKCAKGNQELTAEDKTSCANHFVWLLFRRSLNLASCREDEPDSPFCDPAIMHNPGLDACLNPVLSKPQMHDCILRIMQNQKV
uniref:Uncharacterized protein n=1 Tax=Hanusia phi TaxID=3032 RepID=A0A7S0HES8_9CRYP|mmetsp:Transcript_15647/g.35830  ORF Transcript_15647/g.35830 Transcript_15647/m.35830 type:complete len:393 (+) Transcript_15647:73-1251(+)